MSELPAQNLDQLSFDEQSLVAYLFKNLVVGWAPAYMIEVRLDDPLHHLCEGREGLTTHGGSGSPHYAKHLGDDNWAVIHCDSPEWKRTINEEKIARGVEIAALLIEDNLASEETKDTPMGKKECKYKTYAELAAAFASGELDSKLYVLVVDNDNASLSYRGDDLDEDAAYEHARALFSDDYAPDVVEICKLAGIPAEGV